ncbi:hypothetical protein Q8F55_001063 [Vanrija albida]|uniref:Late embryogenesis abundant protein LEA-2 subgroup domain-containing protein n=1 Tax=Vanrija albida TaxID=181172 RepID=A0ABR3QF79_9TREE
MSKFYMSGDGRAASIDEPEYRAGGSGRPKRSNKQQKDEYYELGEERDLGFDVRADFDGTGPRWSEMYGVAKNEQYRPVYDHVAPSGTGEVGARPARYDYSEARDPEMVSVPVLGPEWEKGELHAQSRRGKKEIKADKRNTAIKAWNRDQRGMCGISWLTRTWFVFIAFFFIAALIVVLFFTIPRAAVWQWYDADPVLVYNETAVLTRVPANFSFDADLHLLVDASTSWLPVRFSNVQATVYDVQSQKIIAQGNKKSFTVQNKKDQPVVFPIHFQYIGINTSDTTWAAMYDACQFQFNGVERADLKWTVEVRQSIIGMVTKPVSTDSFTGVKCPFQFSDKA